MTSVLPTFQITSAEKQVVVTRVRGKFAKNIVNKFAEGRNDYHTGVQAMNWRVKGVVQRALSVMPGGARINDVLQRAVGGLRDFAGEVDGKIMDWSIVMSYLRELGFEVRGARCLEIGTGWFPTLPVCFSLAGAAQCSTFDLCRHLNSRLTLRMLDILEHRVDDIATASGRTAGDVDAAFYDFRLAATISALLRIAGISYYAPADATATCLANESVDLVYSNSVLEHVSYDVMAALMRESMRVLRPGGLIVNGVNCGDHYAYFDRRITAINYLTYSEQAWRFWNNKLQYQNRLRPRDFLEAVEKAGLEIVLERHRPRPELLRALPTMAIAPEFIHYPPEELCSTSIDLVARKP